MLLSAFEILLLVLSEAFLVWFWVGITRDKPATRMVMKFRMFEMPSRGRTLLCRAPSPGKAKDRFESNGNHVGRPKRAVARGGIVARGGQRYGAESRYQRARDEA